MDALGHPTRRAIFEQLRSGARSVGEIAAELPVSRPAVSQHLRVLKEAGLVTERRNGTRRLYRLNPDGLDELRRYVEDYWTDALAAFKAEAVFEPQVGGRVYSMTASGQEHEWATVTAWEPPSRVAVDWHVTAGKPSTELEVRFVPEGDG